MEEKKKSNAGLIIFVVILLLACVGMGAFIFINKDKLLTKDNNSINDNQNNNKTEEESVTFSDSELEKYINYINPVSYGPAQEIYNVDSINAKKLSAREKIEYIGVHVLTMNRQEDTQDGYTKNMIDESDVKKLVEEVYGPNTYERTTFNLKCGDYSFDEQSKQYSYITGGCGGTSPFFVSNVITDYKATKSKLEITTSYAFFDGDTNKFYKDYNKSVPLDEYTGSNTENPTTFLKDYVNNNKDKLNTIVYTFESSDGENYYFTGLKNNK